MACGVGVSNRCYLHGGGCRGNHRNLCTARGGTFDFADGIVPSARVDTQVGGRFIDAIPARRGRGHVGADECRLGDDGFLSCYAMVRREDATGLKGFH